MNVNVVDFAIITILPEEYDAIFERFKPEPYRHPVSQYTYGISRLTTRQGKSSTVAIARSSQGTDASQQLANRMIQDLNPGMFLVVGIAGGVPDNDFTLGDVIISSRIHNFNVHAIKGTIITYDAVGGIHPIISDITDNLYLHQKQLSGWNSAETLGIARPVLRLTKNNVRTHLEESIDEEWRKKVEAALFWHFDRNQRGARAAKFLTGSIASSNALIRSAAILAQWLQNVRSIRAVEMEAAGVYQAAQQIRQQYPVMAIRGISDIIGFKRDDNWKLYACQTAAAFAYAFTLADIFERQDYTSSSADNKPGIIPPIPSIELTKPSQEKPAMPSEIQNMNDNPGTRPIKIFTIYANPDKSYKERLTIQLSPYITWNKIMDMWDRDRINVGSMPMQQEIDRHIDTSQIILLLVSPHFPASPQCFSELSRALQNRENNKTTIIIPIYVRATDWQKAPFEGLLTLPRNEKPVNEWSNQDAAWYDVAIDIRKACDELRNPSGKK